MQCHSMQGDSWKHQAWPGGRGSRGNYVQEPFWWFLSERTSANKGCFSLPVVGTAERLFQGFSLLPKRHLIKF